MNTTDPAVTAWRLAMAPRPRHEVEILSEPAARWADLFGAAPNYTGGVPVDEWLEAHRGEA